MTIFSNRDLEKIANLQANWRKELLFEFVRLRKDRLSTVRCDLPASAEATDSRPCADDTSQPGIDLPRN